MSRLNELVAETAEGGVEFRRLGDLCTVFNGYAFKSQFFNVNGDGLPLIRIRDVNTGLSDTYFSGKYDSRWIVERDDILIGMDGDFRATRWKHGRALLNQRVCRLQDLSDDLLPDFLFYKVQDELNRIHSSITGSTVKHLSSRDLEKALIPVPPLARQREIVAILNTFTELEADLEAELEAEVVARRGQLEHYRDSMLAFRHDPEVPWAKMSDVGQFKRGRRFTKADRVARGIPSIHYGEIYTHYGVSATSAVSFVDEELRPTLRFAHPGDVVIASVGETVDDVGKAVAWLGEEDVAIHDDCFAFSHSMNPTFVSYYFETAAFHAEKNKFVARAKVKRLSATDLGRLAIPVPTPATQERLVAILDQFGLLVNDLSLGLPAELAARRQQYEHYRDRLLTFEEAPA